jgi:vacuolar-type H+-ATPase subunit F/Vma7
MNRSGFTVNHSADNVQDAVKAYKALSGIPVVTLLPLDAPNVQYTSGVKVVACPADKSDKISCSNCGLCALSERDYVIGFRVHGTQKKKAGIIAKG